MEEVEDGRGRQEGVDGGRREVEEYKERGRIGVRRERDFHFLASSLLLSISSFQTFPTPRSYLHHSSSFPPSPDPFHILPPSLCPPFFSTPPLLHLMILSTSSLSIPC